MHSFSGLTLGHKTTTIIVPITPRNLHELEELATAGKVDEVRARLFDIVAQVRGEKPPIPALRVVSNA